MQMYKELAEWWSLLSAPEEYAGEAAVFNRLLTAAGSPPQRTLVELGCVGGNIRLVPQGEMGDELTEVSPRSFELRLREFRWDGWRSTQLRC